MKYSIFYLLSGEAKKYNQKLINETAEISGERYIIEVSKLPPHVSLKSSFELKDSKELEKVLKDFTKKHKKAKIKVRGFSNFRRFVAFIKTDFSPEAKKIQKELVLTLKKELKIESSEHDLKFKPHVTICYGNTKETFDILWNHLKKLKKPEFDLEFDSLALMKKSGTRYKLYKEFRLK